MNIKINKFVLAKILQISKEYRIKNPYDTASDMSLVVIMNDRIERLKKHIVDNKKDVDALRKLLKINSNILKYSLRIMNRK